MAGGEIYVSFGGDTAGLEASLASANASVRAFARELAAISAEQVKAGASAESALGQKMLAVARQLDEAKKSSSELKAQLGEGGEAAEGGLFARVAEGAEGALMAIVGIEAGLSEFAELAAAAFAVERIAEWGAEVTETAEKIQSVAASMGVSAAEVQQLGAMAKLSGTDFGELQTQIERLQLTLAKADAATTPAADALKVLGINLAEFRRLTPAAQVDELAEKFSHFADGAGKTAAATALLGKSGADLIPFLDKGKQGFEEMNAATQRAGAVMSGETVDALAQTRDHINELSLAWTALSQRMFTLVDPAFDLVVRGLTFLVEHIDIQALIDRLGALATDLAGGADNIAAFARGAEEAWTELENVVLGAALDITGAMRRIEGSLGLGADAEKSLGDSGAAAFGGMDAAATQAQLRLQGVRDSADAATRAMQELLRQHAAIEAGVDVGGGDITVHARPKPKPQVPMMDLSKPGTADDTAYRDAQQTAEKEVSDAKTAAQQQEKLEDEKLRDHRESMATWLQDTLKTLSAEAVAVQASYDKEAATAGLTSEQIKGIKLKEQTALAEIAAKETDAQVKAAEATAQSWETAAKSIDSAFDGQIKDLLEGTENWGDAFKKVLEDLTIKIIEWAIDWGVEQAKTEAMNLLGLNAQVAAHTAANAAMAASDQASAAVGLAPMLANAVKAIAADAGQAGAGVTAFMAPLIGPAAPAAGAAVGAEVLGFSALGGLYDAGSWNVPHDMVAGLHAGEVVIPQRGGLADQFRDLAGGGGFSAGGGRAVNVSPSTHFHVNAIDGASVAQWARANGPELAKAMEQAARHGALLATRWRGA